MKRDHIFFAGFLALLVFNFFLTYMLMWNPFSLYFNRPEFSEIHFETRDKLVLVISLLNFIVLWGATILMLAYWKKKNWLKFFAPIVSLMTFWLFMEIQDFYPDANSEWTENGHQIKVQKWYLDGENVYKRWKSQDSLKAYSNHYSIIWKLDSIYEE